jgi:hypothetical protein
MESYLINPFSHRKIDDSIAELININFNNPLEFKKNWYFSLVLNKKTEVELIINYKNN